MAHARLARSGFALKNDALVLMRPAHVVEGAGGELGRVGQSRIAFAELESLLDIVEDRVVVVRIDLVGIRVEQDGGRYIWPLSF
jgi:hypothetical protein